MDKYGKKIKRSWRNQKDYQIQEKIIKSTIFMWTLLPNLSSLADNLTGNSVKNKYDDCQNKCKNCESTHNKKCKVQKTYVQKLKN